MTDFRVHLDGPDPDLVRAILGDLDANDRTILYMLWAGVEPNPTLPGADPREKLRRYALLKPDRGLTDLGETVLNAALGEDGRVSE